MARKRTIDSIADRYCGNCGKLIPKQKPGGKWKTPAQYSVNNACCVLCSRAMRNKTKLATAKAKKTGQITITLSAMDLYLMKPRK